MSADRDASIYAFRVITIAVPAAILLMYGLYYLCVHPNVAEVVGAIICWLFGAGWIAAFIWCWCAKTNKEKLAKLDKQKKAEEAANERNQAV